MNVYKACSGHNRVMVAFVFISSLERSGCVGECTHQDGTLILDRSLRADLASCVGGICSQSDS
jgi:hypothetical protein